MESSPLTVPVHALTPAASGAPGHSRAGRLPFGPFRLTGLLLLLGVTILAGGRAPAQQASPVSGGSEPGGPARGGEVTYLIRVRIHDRVDQVPRLAGLRMDVAGVNVKNQTVDIVGGGDDFMTLLSEGFDAAIQPSYAPETMLAGLQDYMDPAEIEQKLNTYAATYPGLCRMVRIATTLEGRPEWALKISDNPLVEEDEPVIFFVGQHHAREVMTSEIAMDIVDYLLARYATDAKVRHWVDANEIWVVPSHNPDGVNYVFTASNMWRKNRRPNHDGSYGVDLNRNYPFKWAACDGSSGTPGADDYRGPSAGSELETQGFMQLATDEKPAIVMSYHTYSELVLHPYGCDGVLPSETRVLRDMSSDVAVGIVNDAGNGYYTNGTGWEVLYSVDGEMADWFYGELGTYALSIEANGDAQGFQPSYATWRDSTVTRNRHGWQYLLDRLEGPGISGHVTDACTEAPLSATTSLDEVVFSSGETPRETEPGFGRFTWLAPPGGYHLAVTKSGYEPQSWIVEVGHAMAARDVRLVPSRSYAAEPLSVAVDDSDGDGDNQLDAGETVTLPITVKATGEALTNLTGDLTTSDPYVTVTRGDVSFGSVSGGGSATSASPHAEIRVSPQAPDGHLVPLTLTFQASQSLCSPVSGFETRVTTGSPACPAIEEPLDANPGWTIQNSDSSGWAFGPPQGGGGSTGPPSARTGSNVYGTNLAGNYGNNASYTLTTNAFDVSGLRDVELRYWRWLNNEPGSDVARIEASTDGASWTQIWKGFGRDSDWQLYRHDLSGIAGGASTLFIRFRLTSDSTTTGSGFYLDDISLCGETRAPAPRLVIASWGVSDGVKPSCSDQDSHADGGEIADLTVTLRNDGNRMARAVEAFVSATDNADIGLVNGRAGLGDVAIGGTGQAVFRFKVADSVSCREPGTITIEASADSGAYAVTAGQLNLVMEANDGTPVPDAEEDFESSQGWTLGSEWQIDRPRGLGGSGATGGAGGTDPGSAVSGRKVLGLDLTGLGQSKGNYENAGGGATYVATSPVYDCSGATGVDISFSRWLCAEGNTSDRAAFEVFDGTTWQTVWTNPSNDMSETSWQQVGYDVSQYADGNPDFQVRFSVTPNIHRAFCGWNVDDLVIENGYTPQLCDTNSCATGCAPTTEAQNVAGARGASGDVFTWTPSADPCRESSGGPAYRVYRSTDPRPRTLPVIAWPADTYFTDVSGRDGDGSATDATFTEQETPVPGGAFYYLVVVMGSSGAEGPAGHYGP